jgi:hypothetical protein
MTTKAKQTKIVNAIDQAVKTLSQSKRDTAKPSAVTYVATKAHIELAREAGGLSKVIQDNQEYFNKIAGMLRDAKVVIGDARKCPLAKAFLAARFTGKVAASTKANALLAFRKAVSSGKEYSENAYRKADAKKETAKKGAQTAPKADDTKKVTHVEASETATTYQCTIARKGSAKKAAQTLRDLINKMKSSEEYSGLCLALIDALDEFDGE